MIGQTGCANVEDHDNREEEEPRPQWQDIDPMLTMEGGYCVVGAEHMGDYRCKESRYWSRD